jgi:hypothetical protein
LVTAKHHRPDAIATPQINAVRGGGRGGLARAGGWVDGVGALGRKDSWVPPYKK